MKHSDYITHISNQEDLSYLRTQLNDVNIRLFHTSLPYRDLVQKACDYIKFLTITQMEGYKLPHGMSGANAGIPWNIIGIARNRGTRYAHADIMINPHILIYEGEEVESMSNCGSLILDKPIEIKRYEKIYVRYYSYLGIPYEEWFTRDQGGFTIQHEIDHNNGILITDRT